MKTPFPHAYVLDVMSDDHPGIISAVSTAVEDREVRP
jgi:predicted amino acid-binding ACT domain protein